jgi:hypothetical protein
MQHINNTVIELCKGNLSNLISVIGKLEIIHFIHFDLCRVCLNPFILFVMKRDISARYSSFKIRNDKFYLFTLSSIYLFPPEIRFSYFQKLDLLTNLIKIVFTYSFFLFRVKIDIKFLF